jgi:hypothetical protein
MMTIANSIPASILSTDIKLILLFDSSAWSEGIERPLEIQERNPIPLPVSDATKQPAVTRCNTSKETFSLHVSSAKA